MKMNCRLKCDTKLVKCVLGCFLVATPCIKCKSLWGEDV